MRVEVIHAFIVHFKTCVFHLETFPCVNLLNGGIYDNLLYVIAMFNLKYKSIILQLERKIQQVWPNLCSKYKI